MPVGLPVRHTAPLAYPTRPRVHGEIGGKRFAQDEGRVWSGASSGPAEPASAKGESGTGARTGG